MRGLLKVTTPASNLALLTPEERRLAAGLSAVDVTQDAALLAMDLRVSASICSECNVAIASGNKPTLKQETLEETFRVVRGGDVILARRHDVEILSVIGDGLNFMSDDYVVDPEVGILRRLYRDELVSWCVGKLTVSYKAGFAEVPDDLKMAALDFLRLSWMEQFRDPSMKSEEVDIPDVMRTKRDFWVGVVPGMSGEGAVPAIVSGQLVRFRNCLSL